MTAVTVDTFYIKLEGRYVTCGNSTVSQQELAHGFLSCEAARQFADRNINENYCIVRRRVSSVCTSDTVSSFTDVRYPISASAVRMPLQTCGNF